MAKSKVFISYRRDDSSGSAGRLYDHLSYILGEEQVFTDVDDIPLGVDFRQVIEEAIEQSEIVLVIIGRHYIHIKDAQGQARIMSENDFVHLEVRYALEKGKRVIPVLVNNGIMPQSADLPPVLEPLCFLNAYELRHEKWREDVKELGRIVQAILRQVDTGGNADKLPPDPSGGKEYTISELNRLYEERAFEEVLPLLRDHYVPLNPADPEGFILLGHTYENLNKDEEAEASYREALRLSPTSSNALTGLGVLYRKRKDYDQAAACYEKAIEADSTYAGAYSSLSIIYIKNRDFLNAVRVAEKGYQLDKSNPVNAANLSVAYHYAGDLSKRDDYLKKALKAGYPAAHAHTLERIFKGEMTLLDN